MTLLAARKRDSFEQIAVSRPKKGPYVIKNKVNLPDVEIRGVRPANAAMLDSYSLKLFDEPGIALSGGPGGWYASVLLQRPPFGAG